MSTRVTNLSMQNQALYNLQSQMGRMAKLNDQMTTGRAFNKPSEDPTATVTAMRVRADQRVNAQYERNVRDGKTWMDAADSAIQGSMDLLRKARDLTVQGSNTGSYGPASLRAIASEVRALSEGIRQQANTQVNGRSIFAGNSDADEAFAADGTHAGSGGTVERRISGATTVRVDADGEAVYGNGASSVFATLNELATLLETPDVDGKDVAAPTRCHGWACGTHCAHYGIHEWDRKSHRRCVHRPRGGGRHPRPTAGAGASRRRRPPRPGRV